MFLDILYEFRNFFKDIENCNSEFIYFLSFGFLPRKYEKGTIIYNQNELVEEMYLIRKGRVSVGFKINEEHYEIAELVPTSSFGDYYILKHKMSEFNYQAETTVEVIGITREHLLEAVERYPKKGKKLIDEAVERYSELRKAIVILKICMMNSMKKK